MAVKIRTEINIDRVVKRVRKGAREGLKSIGAYTRKTARNMVRNKTKSNPKSLPGQVPLTANQKNRNLRSAVIFALERNDTVLIGPSANVISRTQYYHEFGQPQTLRGKRKDYKIGWSGPIRPGPVFAKLKTQRQVERAKRLDKIIWPDGRITKTRRYPKRPLMGPTLARVSPHITRIWNAAII